MSNKPDSISVFCLANQTAYLLSVQPIRQQICVLSKQSDDISVLSSQSDSISIVSLTNQTTYLCWLANQTAFLLSE